MIWVENPATAFQRVLGQGAGRLLLACRVQGKGEYESRLTYRGQVQQLVDGQLGGERAGAHLRSLLARASEAEREAVLEARRSGQVSLAAADDVLFDIEARALRYQS